MEALINFSRKYPVIVIVLILAGCVISALNVGKLWIDTSSDSMMMRNDPERIFYEETLEKFGSDNMMMIYIQDEQLFSVSKLTILDELVQTLGDGTLVPGIQRIESLFSVSNMKGYPDYLDNNPLMDYVPETDAEASAVKEDALANPILVGNLISRTGNATVVNLYLKANNQDETNLSEKTAEAVSRLLNGTEENPGYGEKFDTIFEIGTPYTSNVLTALILKDMTTLMPIAFGILLFMLIITMGSFNGAILPLITSSLSILFTLGFMGAFNLPLNLLTFSVPILVIVIGSTEDVHMLAEYQEGLHKFRRRTLAIKFMSRSIGTAVFLTSLTTFLGFLSISINKVIVLIQFGITAGFALFINPLTTCLIAPVYLRFLGAKQPASQKRQKATALSRGIDKFAAGLLTLIEKYKVFTFVLMCLVACGLGVFSVKIKVDNDTLSFFKKDSEIKKRMNIMHEELSGGQIFYISLARDNPVTSPDTEASPAKRNAAGEAEETRSNDKGMDEVITIDEGMDEEITINEGMDDVITIDEGMDDVITIDEGMDDVITIDEGMEDMITIDEGMEDVITIDDGMDEVITIDDGRGSPSRRGTDEPGVDSAYAPDSEDNLTRNLFHNPKYLKLVADIQFKLDTEYDFDKTISIADYIRLMHKEMNVGQPGNFNQVPDPGDPSSRNLIAQYALNLHHDEISSYITSDWNEANIMVRHYITSSSETVKFLKRLNKDLEEMIYKVDPYVSFKVTGISLLVNKAADSIATSQITGLGLLLITILIIMSVLFTNIKAGLLSLIPNLFPVAIFFGTMGIFNVPLNLGTCMVAAIAIGISVDDTIHFMTRYNMEMRNIQDRSKAVAAVIQSEIRPILSTSLALTLGFAILAWSNLIPILYFGVFSALVMVCALFADLLLTPILLSSIQLTNLSEMAGLKLAGELKSSPLFQGMSMWEIKRFALMGRVVRKEAGDYIMKTGDAGQYMCIILSGKVNIERTDSITGKSTYITSLGIGALIGEISILGNVARTADVIAEEPVSYMEMDWAGFMRIERSSKKISSKLFKNIARILGQRLVRMTDRLEELSQEQV